MPSYNPTVKPGLSVNGCQVIDYVSADRGILVFLSIVGSITSVNKVHMDLYARNGSVHILKNDSAEAYFRQADKGEVIRVATKLDAVSGQTNLILRNIALTPNPNLEKGYILPVEADPSDKLLELLQMRLDSPIMPEWAKWLFDMGTARGINIIKKLTGTLPAYEIDLDVSRWEALIKKGLSAQ